MYILGIDTSCDDTSVAILKDGYEVISNLVSSQNDIHQRFGGVVPELASRRHLENITPMIKLSLEEAKIDKEDISVIGVTYGPGLVGSLLVGLMVAKGLAYSLKKPLIGINHMEGHIFGAILEHRDLYPPFIALVVSGGHTDLVLVRRYFSYEIIGSTRDDAAGEAFDKVARLLDIGYPGGPAIERFARLGSIDYNLPRAIPEGYDFSFSGLKTAVIRLLKGKENIDLPSVAYSFQEAVVDVLVDKSLKACTNYKINRLAISGGVAANGRLREKFLDEAKNYGIDVYFPSIKMCTDNATMICSATYYRYLAGHRSDLTINAESYCGYPDG
ncbi:MAG TPA: tRNA (adenosine(37)-N6)-threonylcarbamoyltransferase complex transferase subunit TsaD [bacterium]|nr:tRNA (adenosine(37)-N6)-threonylcarbamoyltransferase complex transferase subunit TsaD [Dictyoglomota bacterium]HHV80735.1 tRNA (adenosine(37)-N6)-threonylcarbamoyltransferase complex transferase subunit TsaD [bacterium]HOK29460.1 tRNA (adenosine(37)-N6)-threonylcarbamoyltransferase complex transferase subunit TsaD [bacterium]HOP56364.1 tRNA (adenosine(37)-N6)-threonylcarbamoyltransferase complex transferase subunit TsaD [bacterium]